MKKQFKRTIAMFSATCLTLAVCLSGCGNSSNPAPSGDGSGDGGSSGQVIEASLAHVMAVGSPADLGANRFAELVSEKTGGAIQINVYPNSQLGGDRDVIEAQQLGSVDFSLPGTSIYSQFEPTLGVFCMPFLYEDAEAAHAVLDSDVAAEIYSVTANQNITVLTTFESGFRQLGTANRAVNSLADIHGLRIRIPEGDIYVKTWSALGTNGTALAWNELFSALQTGVVEGEEAPLANFAASGFGEVCKYFAYINYNYDPLMLTVSNAFWDKLTDEQKAAVQEAAYEARDYEREVNAQQEAELEAQLIEEWGVTFTHPDLEEFKAAVQTVYDTYEYQDELKMLQDFLANR